MQRHIRRQSRDALWFGCLFVLACGGLAAADDPVLNRQPLLMDVDRLVREKFFDPDLRGAAWSERVEQIAEELDREPTLSQAISRINGDLLAILQTSHTRVFSPDEPAYYELLSLFARNPDLQELVQATARDGQVDLTYVDFGMRLEPVAGRWHVRHVLPGSPAEMGGILVGDEIVSVVGRAWPGAVRPELAVDQPVTLVFRRRAGEGPRTIELAPRRYDPSQMYVDGLRQSARVIESGDKSIGYARVWSWAGTSYQRVLEELVFDTLADCDALVLDLRGPWGGASLSGLDLFDDRGPELQAIDREGRSRALASHWTKPVVLVTDDSVRSGKEMIAYVFQQRGRGPLVGTRTAGAVMAGQCFPIAERAMLYLAVMDCRIDGQRLEGVGVEPTIVVDHDWPYAAGHDPSLERAIVEAERLAQRAK